MTREDALLEAQRRWGSKAYIWTHDYRPEWHLVSKRYDTIMGREIQGQGDSWEAAFSDADRREQEGKK